MENFKKNFEKIKQKNLLPEGNIINNLYNYILNDIVEDYRIGYIFYIFLEDSVHQERENILELSLVINMYFIMIDVIYNLPFCLNNKLTDNNLSVHEIFNETITTLGIMYTINHLTKLHLSILERMNLKQVQIINQILPIFDENITLLNMDMEDKDIDIILGNNNKRKNILEKIKKDKKKKYFKGVLKYIEILDREITFSDNESDILYRQFENKNINNIKSLKV